MRLLLSCMFFVALALSGQVSAFHDPEGRPHWQKATQWPDRIVVTSPGEATTGFSVTWRTDQTVGAALVEIVKATPSVRFDLQAETRRSKASRLELEAVMGPDGEVLEMRNQGLDPVHFHTYTFKELEPDTLYAYRVRVAPGKWSAWRQVRTAAESGPVQFLFFGDSQQGIRSHITRLFDTAAKAAPEASFAVHGGDLVDQSMHDREWAEWFEAQGRLPVTTVTYPIAGNHDYFKFREGLKPQPNGERQHNYDTPRILTPMWRKQFALPQSDDLPPELAETVYDFRRGKDLHMFVLDSMASQWDAQITWLDRKLAATDAEWRVVSMHHPLFVLEKRKVQNAGHVARHRSLMKVLNRHKVDLVLTGHYHAYIRGRMGEKVAKNKVGEDHAIQTAFIVTAAAAGMGEVSTDGVESRAPGDEGDFSLSRTASFTPMFVVVDIDGKTLQVRAIDATGATYDSFSLLKNSDGTKTLTDAPEAHGTTRDANNSGPYRSWDDLL